VFIIRIVKGKTRQFIVFDKGVIYMETYTYEETIKTPEPKKQEKVKLL